MGINPTQSNFKSFTFDGENSRNYGVYITGEGVFNAPERNVEMIDIAGRNGAYALDRGNFKNIEIVYPASIATDEETDFAEAVSDLRNFLCSRVGYVRLEDDYNPDEYRLAVYKSGLEVTHEMLIAGEFELKFECKPQRFLKSGETAVSVTSGDTITNPTLFDAKPQLQVCGHGDIDIGGSVINVFNVPIGEIIAFPAKVYNASETQISGGVSITQTKTFAIDDTYANANDVITVKHIHSMFRLSSQNAINSIATSGSGDVNFIEHINGINPYSFYINCGVENKQFYYGTSSTKSGTGTFVVNTTNDGDLTSTITVSLSYDGTNTFTISLTITMPARIGITTNYKYPQITINDILLNSTQSALGNPMYIDLDIGECYKIENGAVVSVNDAVSLPANLGILPPGANTIIYDNTFTSFKVVPRWWSI